MELEEKIESLSPELRKEVETFIDFLISREKNFSENESDEAEIEKPDSNVNTKKNKDKLKNSGIILAVEDAELAAKPDAIDFADINTRFGRDANKKDSEEKKPKRPSRYRVDWL